MKQESKSVITEESPLAVVGGDGQGASSRRINPSAAIRAVTQAVCAWEGVTVHEHRFGGVEFRLGRRELGHLHSSFADLPFPKTIRDRLVTSRRAKPHHILPDSGWVTAPMRSPADVAAVIELFRQNYERKPAS
jgi:hypothetical protein